MIIFLEGVFMSAINLACNTNLVYSEVNNNTIFIKNNDDNKIVFTFPIPKNFQISGIANYGGRPCYVITPYKLNYPKFIPEGYGELEITPCGLWCATKNGSHITYIDTSILSAKDFDYVTLGKFKIEDSEIPKPFWCPRFLDDNVYGGWIKPSDINKIVNRFRDECNKNARLIYEEELLSIFALNDYGFDFWEELPLEFENQCFFKNLPKCFLGAGCYGTDNWHIVVASRANRNLYRLILRTKDRDHESSVWYLNTSFTKPDDKVGSYHVFPVIDGNYKIEENQDYGYSRKLIKK
jgi:hypothetical protein